MSKRVDMTRLMKTIEINKSLLLKSSLKDDRYNIVNEMAELLVSKDTSRVLRYDMKSDTVSNDTIGGPRFIDGTWKEVDGEIKIFLDKASEDKDNIYVLILNDIDEVKNLSSALDDVLSRMEQRDCSIMLNNGRYMMVSSNVYVIATVTMIRGLDRWTLDRFIMYDLEDKTMYKKIISSLERDDMVKNILLKYRYRESISEMLAIMLVQTLDIVYKASGHIQPVKTTIITDKPRGKIDLERSIQCGAYFEGKLVCEVYERSIDNKYMQLIKFAMETLLQYEKIDGIKMSDYVKNQFVAILGMLNEVSDIIYDSSMLYMDAPICYKPVMTVCKAIIEECRKEIFNNKFKMGEV